MGLGEGNQAWAGTSAWMSLNIVHADNSFRLLKRHWLPYTCMLLCLTPRLCCVLPFFSPFRGEREAACLYVNANPCRVFRGGVRGTSHSLRCFWEVESLKCFILKWGHLLIFSFCSSSCESWLLTSELAHHVFIKGWAFTEMWHVCVKMNELLRSESKWMTEHILKQPIRKIVPHHGLLSLT